MEAFDEELYTTQKPIDCIRVKLEDPIEIHQHLCHICQNYAIDPRQCPYTLNDSPCSALFCRTCLEAYLRKSPVCPRCRSSIVSATRTFRAPQDEAFYRKHYLEIPLKCQHSECPLLFNLESLFDHQLHLCPERVRPCKICCQDVKVARETLQQHYLASCSINTSSYEHLSLEAITKRVWTVEEVIRSQESELDHLRKMCELQVKKRATMDTLLMPQEMVKHFSNDPASLQEGNAQDFMSELGKLIQEQKNGSL